jgi:hypothetical protein
MNPPIQTLFATEKKDRQEDIEARAFSQRQVKMNINFLG